MTSALRNALEHQRRPQTSQPSRPGGGRFSNEASLVTDALRMAWFRRHPVPGLIYHSDHGGQYCSHSFQDALASYGTLSSMSRKGNCRDNAPTESLWGSLKVGRL